MVRIADPEIAGTDNSDNTCTVNDKGTVSVSVK